MMEFTLSKINLLILAIALFVIIAQFAFWMKDKVISDISANIAESTIRVVSSTVDTKALCDRHYIPFKRKYTLYDIIDFYYVVELRSEKTKDELSHIVVSIIERNEYLRKRDEATIMHSSARDLNAKVQIFSYLPEIGEPCPTERFVVDVRSAPSPLDMVVVVKETFKGEDYIYLVPCSSQVKGMCERNVMRVGCYIYRKRNEGSNCFDVDVSNCLSAPVPSCWGG